MTFWLKPSWLKPRLKAEGAHTNPEVFLALASKKMFLFLCAVSLVARCEIAGAWVRWSVGWHHGGSRAHGGSEFRVFAPPFLSHLVSTCGSDCESELSYHHHHHHHTVILIMTIFIINHSCHHVQCWLRTLKFLTCPLGRQTLCASEFANSSLLAGFSRMSIMLTAELSLKP